MSSCVILGWLSLGEDVFLISFMPGYIWLFFPPFKRGLFFIVWPYDLVFMFSMSQARKLALILFCSFLSHCLNHTCLGHFLHVLSQRDPPKWFPLWPLHPSLTACCRSHNKPHPPGRSSKLSYIIIDTCFTFRLIRRFGCNIYHQLIYPYNSLKVLSWCCPFYWGGNWDTER